MKELGSSPLSLLDIEEIIFSNVPITVSKTAGKRIEETYAIVERCAHHVTPIYGINTGFGALAEQRINREDQATLQRNVILSHAVGVGEPLDFFVAKTLILLRLNTLVQGFSGASPELINYLVRLLNANCAPLVPKKGSVGASGDLAPLAHLGLLLLGIGDAYLNKNRVNAKDALRHAELLPFTLGVLDGLALINGTQAMTAVAVTALKQSQELSLLADCAASTTLDAIAGHLAPFDPRIHAIKPHPGQIKTATHIRTLVQGRTIDSLMVNKLTQDPYSLRCVPQVHGATKDVIAHVQEIVLREINAVTDNPLIFTDLDHQFEVLSGGNFHGQHLALSLDYLAMAISELANIAERRLELLLNPRHSNGLPAFLIENSGLNSGYMMLHVTASALVNENKIFCHPASTDSIPTSANREDHVSMGMTSANKLLQVISNTKTVLAIEIMAAMQGIDLRTKDRAGIGIKKLHRSLRECLPERKQDGLYYEDLHNTLAWLESKETKHLINDIVNNDNK